MNFQAQPTNSFARLMAVVALLFSIAVLSRANAQWQYVYGDAHTQAGRAGVQQTFDGGFVAVGEADTTTGIRQLV